MATGTLFTEDVSAEIIAGSAGSRDIRFILSIFHIVERQDWETNYGVYLSAELIILYSCALAAGDNKTDAPVATLLRTAER